MRKTSNAIIFAVAALGVSSPAPSQAQQTVGANGWLGTAGHYRLHIPAKDFWSVLVYDSLSRSELKNGEPFPSVSKYSDPKINADGSVDIYFGPNMPADQEKNWVKTVAGKGWFPIFRFYGPLEPLYDKSWVLSDIEKVN